MATLVTDKGVPYIEDIWDIFDFRLVADGYDEEEFSEEDILKAMELVEHNYDANIGINWDTVIAAFDWILYERKKEEND